MMNVIMSNADDNEINSALLPNLSIIKPKNGLATAEIKYGMPNMVPAALESMLYFF